MGVEAVGFHGASLMVGAPPKSSTSYSANCCRKPRLGCTMLRSERQWVSVRDRLLHTRRNMRPCVTHTIACAITHHCRDFMVYAITKDADRDMPNAQTTAVESDSE
jgi:hypothetical protein